MRFTRLQRAIEESRTLNDTHDTPSQGGADEIVKTPRKRNKKSGNSDEEGASVVRTPTSSRLALAPPSSKGVPNSNDTAQESDSDDVPRVTKKPRKSFIKNVVTPSLSGLQASNSLVS